MRRFRRCTLASVPVLLLALALAWPSAPEAQEESGRPVLENEDCAKCHIYAPQDIARGGMAHQTEVGCGDCHAGHPPVEMEIIPPCSDCHEGEPHYGLDACLGCHTNPHMPLEIHFANDVTDPCLTCHDQPGAQLAEFESFHSSMDCSACHNEHRQLPECMMCHDGHSDQMTQQECGICHEPHMPLEITYADATPSRLCAGCHDEAFELLTDNTTRHQELGCAYCHPTEHGTVQVCTDCHGTPHPSGIRAKFPDCNECHNKAHNLNEWSAATNQSPEPTKQPAM